MSSSQPPTAPATPGAEPSDGDLVRLARDGDLGAFERLVERHRRVVVRVADRIVGAREAEDVSQDAFLRAFHRFEQYRGDAPFRSWLLRITHNAALDHLARKRPEPVDPDTLDEAPAPSGTRLPAEQLEVRERIERIELKIATLSPAHRVVLVLRDVEGLSYDEIAAVTDSPLGSVKGRLHRARQELAEILRANTYDWELPR